MGAIFWGAIFLEDNFPGAFFLEPFKELCVNAVLKFL